MADPCQRMGGDISPGLDKYRRAKTSLVAAGVAYYILLALFPAMAAFVSSYGLVENPADVTRHVRALSSLLPASTVKVIGDELHQIVSASSNSLGFGAVSAFY